MRVGYIKKEEKGQKKRAKARTEASAETKQNGKGLETREKERTAAE